MNPNISDEHRKFLTLAWERAVAAGEASDKSAEDYLARVLQSGLDDLAAAACESWRPAEDPEVLQRKEAAAERIKALTPEKLEEIEAALEAATTAT